MKQSLEREYMYLERWQSDPSEWMPGYGGGSSVFSLQKDVLALLEHVKSNMDSIIMVRSSRSLDFFFSENTPILVWPVGRIQESLIDNTDA